MAIPFLRALKRSDPGGNVAVLARPSVARSFPCGRGGRGLENGGHDVRGSRGTSSGGGAPVEIWSFRTPSTRRYSRLPSAEKKRFGYRAKAAPF